jgi:polyhydroxyalkanoate synthesis regulator phasin
MMREGFTLAVGAAAWAFEQGDRLMAGWMERGRISGEAGRRRFDEFAARTRSGLRSAASSVPVASREQVTELERKVEELARQVEALRRTPPAPPPPPPPRRNPPAA